MITPIEIQNKVFKSGGLGYDKRDVDQFVREILDGYETLYREKVELNDKMAVLSEGLQYYKTIEKTMQKALVLAEKTAEDVKNAAQKNARRIEKEAETKAQIILSDARRELDQVYTQTKQLLTQYDIYKAQIKSLVSAQLELLESDSFRLHSKAFGAFEAETEQNEAEAAMLGEAALSAEVEKLFDDMDDSSAQNIYSDESTAGEASDDYSAQGEAFDIIDLNE